VREGDEIFIKGDNENDTVDFDRLLNKSRGPPTQHVHLRENLRYERAFVREALKAHKGSSRPSPSPIPAVTLATFSPIPRTPHHTAYTSVPEPSQKRKRSEMFDPPSSPFYAPASSSQLASPTPLPKFPDDHNHSISVKVEDIANIVPHTACQTRDIIDLTISDDDEDKKSLYDKSPPRKHRRCLERLSLTPPPLTQIQPRSPYRSPSIVIIDDEPRPSPNPHHSKDLPQWPKDFYYCDVVDGFTKCEAAAKYKDGVARTFESLFGVQWVHGTYYSNLSFWRNAPQNLRDATLKANRTEAGRWKVFRANVNQHTRQQRRSTKPFRK